MICIAHTKGGVGKSTSAILLALALHRTGAPVRVLDADAQGTASTWAAIAADDQQPLPFPVLPYHRDLLDSSTASHWTIIDTPPGSAAVIQQAIDAADLVIVPTAPSPADVQRVWPTLAAVAHRLTVILLTQADLRTRLLTEVRDVFEAEGIPVLHTVITRREALRRTYGTTPERLYGYNDVLTEIQEVLT